MLNPTEEKKSAKYANIDMDKFKFDFHLFVPAENGTNTSTGQELSNK